MVVNNIVNEEKTHVTDNGTIVRADVSYSANGNTVNRLEAIDPRTGTIHPLSEREKETFSLALQAGHRADRAAGQIPKMEDIYNRLANALGADNPNIVNARTELHTVQQFAAVARGREELLIRELNHKADAAVGHGLNAALNRDPSGNGRA